MTAESNRAVFNEKYKIIGEKTDKYIRSPNMHDMCEYIYCGRGNCILYVNFEQIILNEGEAYFLIPQQLHSAESGENCEIWVVSFSNEAIPFFKEYVNIDNFSSHPYKPAPNVNEYVFTQAVNKKCADIITLYACANMIFSDFLQNNPQPDMAVHQKNDSTIAINAIKYMRNHYREKLTLSQTAKAVGTSPSYLSRIMSSTNGLGFSGYLDELRISYAQMLLRTTDMKIADIAKSSGYYNIRTFNRKFQEYYHQSPTQHRKKNKK